jgi:hypothetical protein
MTHDVPIPPPIPPWTNPYHQYERLKKQLVQLNLTPSEYAQRIKRIADWIGV